MTEAIFQTEIHDDAVEIALHKRQGLRRRDAAIPVAEWAHHLPEHHHPILAVVDNLLEDCGSRADHVIRLPHASVAGLTEAQAALLGLPPPIPFAFDIRSSGMIDHGSFSLSTSWVTPGGVREFITRQGAFAHKGLQKYRIPSPVYDIVQAAEVLANASANDNAERYQALASLYEILPKDEHGNAIRIDHFLGSIRVLHASSFSLHLPTDSGSFQFDPVLFSRKTAERAAESERILDEAENLLTPNLQRTFAGNRFKRWKEVRDCYALEEGTYVYLDPDLKKALGVVRTMQEASAEERQAFIRSPQRTIRERLGDDLAAEAMERLFVETEQYAENVVGLGIWQPPVIPWLVREPNSWLPEKFGLHIGETYVHIPPEDVTRLRDEIASRLNAGFGEQPQEPFIYETPEGPVAIPVTLQTQQALDNIIGYTTAAQTVQNQPAAEQEEVLVAKASPFFLLVEDNIHDAHYIIDPVQRATSKNIPLPVALKTPLKLHQQEGLRWLIDAWTQGAPGVLLADDMGLGKTLQALTLLAWLKERKYEGHPQCREPVLIIAPTGLLRNWQNEINTHLREPRLGQICMAYGKNLTTLREGRRKDLETGSISLNRNELRRYDVVLTTYETYRDYHHSFGGIRFSAAVLDECQKIKNPKSQVNRALASMNAEFVIAMTGTPVENAMEDLWAILNRAWPGFLGSLKSFSETYSSDDRQAISDLTARLKGAATSTVSAPILWRRMKEDILDDLPQKTIHIQQVDMPREQADAYRQVVNRAREQNPPPMLHTLHSLRGISLHPIDPSAVLGEASITSYDHYIQGSARLAKAIQILDEVQRKEQKALLFVESLDMQSLMAEILKKRYGLSKRPGIINGKTGGDKIQRLVDDFQADSAFDVMILSPKVGGVGLTLTAANHVVHLSRWWNPAVEDQSTDRVYRIGQKKDVHVYCPMAIHPDTDIRAHSFDLKLHDLLERKRRLSRDMLIPVENPADTENLFKETVGFSTSTTDTNLHDLDGMEPELFEQWALTRASQHGYVADRTPRSWDRGADGIITHKGTGQKFILQCKHSGRDTIKEDKVIQDLLSAREAYDTNAGLVALTNRYFSNSLVRRMDQLGIRYFDRDTISNWPRL